jgi:hypothetical protein
MTPPAESLNRPFFVVGSARSGTTMLRLILNSHPQVAVPPESRFIVELHPDRAGKGSNPAPTVEVKSFLTRLAEHHNFQAWELDIALVAAEIEGDLVPYPEAVEAAYRAFAKAHGKVRWGDKTPRYIEHIPLIRSLFPTARFIHLVRDGRDVALSYAHMDFGPKTVSKAARIWAKRVGAGLAAGRDLDPSCYLELRYEDLVKSTEEIVKEVCDFLDIEFDPRMLDEEERAKGINRRRAGRYNPDIAKSVVKRTRAWEEQMPPSQIEVFEAIAGDVLSTLGYERRFPNPSASARFKAKAGLAGLPIGKLA